MPNARPPIPQQPTLTSFAIGMVGLGILALIYRDFALVWQPVPAWVPARAAIAVTTASSCSSAASACSSGQLQNCPRKSSSPTSSPGPCSNSLTSSPPRPTRPHLHDQRPWRPPRPHSLRPLGHPRRPLPLRLCRRHRRLHPRVAPLPSLLRLPHRRRPHRQRTRRPLRHLPPRRRLGRIRHARPLHPRHLGPRHRRRPRHPTPLDRLFHLLGHHRRRSRSRPEHPTHTPRRIKFLSPRTSHQIAAARTVNIAQNNHVHL